jgi:hypothetical protein
MNISSDMLTCKFMDNLSIGNRFTLNNKSYIVKCIGKWKSKKYNEEKAYKTLTVKCEGDNKLIKFFYFFGYGGNPSSMGYNSSIKQHQFIRDVEGLLIVDLLNINNKFHDMSEIYKIATQSN